MIRPMLTALLMVCASSAWSPGGGCRLTRQVLHDGGTVVTQEVVVAAPVEAVWQALTTSAGWESWAVPFAEVEFRVGGVIESSYRLNAAAGDAGNIHNRILSFLPHRMLSIQAVKAPPGFAHADLLGDLHSVFELAPAGEGRTQVVLSGVGDRNTPGPRALKEHFIAGNAWTLERLRDRFEHGPVDWREQLAPGASGQQHDR